MSREFHTLEGLPVFPLPDYYLFPGSVTPLHIFETRYRQLIKDLMDRSGRLVMAPYDPAAPSGPTGPVLPELGTLAEIVQTEELDDGRWVILLLALTRVRLTEVPSDRLYRKVDAHTAPDLDVTTETMPALRDKLLAALQVRADGEWDDIPANAPIGPLADVLLHALPLDLERRRQAYAERDPRNRATLALAWHELLDPSAGESDEAQA